MFFRGWVRKALFLGEFVRFAVYACADARETAVMRGEWKKILAVGERSLIWTSGVAGKRRNACDLSRCFSVFFIIFLRMSHCAPNYFYDLFPPTPGTNVRRLISHRCTYHLNIGLGGGVSQSSYFTHSAFSKRKNTRIRLNFRCVYSCRTGDRFWKSYKFNLNMLHYFYACN